jgi:hypothetical protein
MQSVSAQPSKASCPALPSMPLHMIPPDYPIPYVPPSVEKVTETLRGSARSRTRGTGWNTATSPATQTGRAGAGRTAGTSPGVSATGASETRSTDPGSSATKTPARQRQWIYYGIQRNEP